MATIHAPHFFKCCWCRQRVGHVVVALVLKDWQHRDHTIARYCGPCAERVLKMTDLTIEDLPF
jgi:hypothetical protein